MGGVNSVPHDPNILDQIKNKDYSVVSINEKKGIENLPMNSNALSKTSNITVSELKNIRTINGTGACTPLPRSIFLKSGNTINKNIFVSKIKGQHIRLYSDKKCRKRANEEEYAVVNPPRENLFYPNYTGTDTEFTFVPYNKYQNAHYYRITDQVINTPRLPQFYIKRKEDPYNVYQNKQFVEYDENEPSVCREIPTDIPEEYPESLDYYFNSKPDDVKNGRETGVDRYPDAKNTKTNSDKFVPITIYSDVLKDKNGNVIKDENNNPTCDNIYTPSIQNGGDKLKDGSHKYPTSNQHYRYTPVPYTKVHNYGTVVADESNSMYYELKGVPGILD